MCAKSYTVGPHVYIRTSPAFNGTNDSTFPEYVLWTWISCMDRRLSLSTAQQMNDCIRALTAPATRHALSLRPEGAPRAAFACGIFQRYLLLPPNSDPNTPRTICRPTELPIARAALFAIASTMVSPRRPVWLIPGMFSHHGGDAGPALCLAPWPACPAPA